VGQRPYARQGSAHWWEKGLTPERAARLLYEHGPCIGILWVTAEYHRFNADVGNAAVCMGWVGLGIT